MAKYKSRVKGKDYFLDSRIVEAIWKGVIQAETGGVPHGEWIRAMNAPPKGSTAFGPGQINRNKAEDFLKRPALYDFTPDELDFIEKEMLPLYDLMKVHGRNSNMPVDTRKVLLSGNPNPNYGKPIIPRSEYTKYTNALTGHPDLQNGEIYYNPIYDYLTETTGQPMAFRGTADNVLNDYYQNDSVKVARFKAMYDQIGKKAIAGTYHDPNKYATQWGYASHSDPSAAGEIGTTIASWRFGAGDADLATPKLPIAHASMIANPQGELGADWERYQTEAMDTIIKELNDPQNPYVFGSEKQHYQLQHNIQEVGQRKATHLIPQIYYEKPKKSGGTEKVFVEADEAVKDIIFSELDFTEFT